ncbi:serine O-acetyltransferase [Motilimonas pumila]|uniref:Serine acetyltransferase n=1 Tax=Motilimonas pumila TaxID=2303987 RepID=A0A418YKY7_9GAMM|nr:DapH/DapD/GlmU-related protein [Motilimonas pumila]RJG51631.1 serine acetyltransferase [Motilimonas pumila]
MPNAIFFYRISRFFYDKKIPFIPKIFQLIIFLLYNSKVPPTAKIGKGSFLVVKGVGVVIIDRAVIGERCRIGIGSKIVGQGPYSNVPQIGNEVFIGPGAVIMGPVKIGDKAIIGANAVVNKSVPDGAIVAGIPAKIIGHIDELEYDILVNEKGDDRWAKELVDTRNK